MKPPLSFLKSKESDMPWKQCVYKLDEDKKLISQVIELEKQGDKLPSGWYDSPADIPGYKKEYAAPAPNSPDTVHADKAAQAEIGDTGKKKHSNKAAQAE
jgi:hypothetical protein